MKKLLIISFFFLFGIVGFAQTSADQNKPQLAEAEKKDSVIAEPGSAQLETGSPASASQKDMKSAGTSKPADETPVLSEVSVPKKKD